MKWNTDRCSRSRSVATVPWATPRGCCRCRRPLAMTATRQSGCSGCCCCYHCCYRFLRCQLVMQPTNQKTSYCQPPNSFLSVRFWLAYTFLFSFFSYCHRSIVALSLRRFEAITVSPVIEYFWRRTNTFDVCSRCNAIRTQFRPDLYSAWGEFCFFEFFSSRGIVERRRKENRTSISTERDSGEILEDAMLFDRCY